MARVKIYGAKVQLTALRFSTPLIRTVLREVEHGAKVRTLHGPYTTGRLSHSIHAVGPIITGLKVRGTVSSDLSYAAAVQSGARPHKIRPRGDGYPLKFYWRKVGHVVRFMHVNHPGQKGKGYLTETLVQVARRHNMNIIIRDF